MRKPLIIGASIAATVLLVIGGVIAVTARQASGPGAVVVGYLEALARGDAAAALSHGSEIPVGAPFLTDEVLAQQIAAAPITAIRIRDESVDGQHARVHVSATFGDTVSDATVALGQSDGGWKLETVAIEIGGGGYLGEDAAARTLTLFGAPLGAATTFVFPGRQAWGTTTSNLEVSGPPILLDRLGALGFDLSDLRFELSGQGRRAAETALRTALQTCTASRSLAPPGCPQSVVDPEALADTATWTELPVAALRLGRISGQSTRVPFTGDLEFGVRYRTRDGGEGASADTTRVTGWVDVAVDPPTVRFD